jgi:phosphoribosyl 1,2-cyclic phosphodiesterase
MSLEVVFIGSGSSSGTPNIRCAMDGAENCVACKSALADPDSKNNRGNPSILIKVPYTESERSKSEDANIHRNILVDVGKTFKRGALKWFRKFGVSAVDAVILTHEHADAILGLDDLREVQVMILKTMF